MEEVQISARVTVMGCSHVCSNPRHSHHERARADYTVQRGCPFENTEVDDDDCEIVRPVANTESTIDDGSAAAAAAGSAFFA